MGNCPALVFPTFSQSARWLSSEPRDRRIGPDKVLKQRVRWDVYLLMLRAIAMFMMAAHGLYFILVPLMALLLTYFEIWPERVLGAVADDPSRLWEYDPEK
jgi:hypothetical protein